MSRSSFLILLGVLTILTPFSGLPVTIRAILFSIFGICVIIVGIVMRSKEAHHSTVEAVHETPTEEVKPNTSPIEDMMTQSPHEPLAF